MWSGNVRNVRCRDGSSGQDRHSSSTARGPGAAQVDGNTKAHRRQCRALGPWIDPVPPRKAASGLLAGLLLPRPILDLLLQRGAFIWAPVLFGYTLLETLDLVSQSLGSLRLLFFLMRGFVWHLLESFDECPQSARPSRTRLGKGGRYRCRDRRREGRFRPVAFALPCFTNLPVDPFT